MQNQNLRQPIHRRQGESPNYEVFTSEGGSHDQLQTEQEYAQMPEHNVYPLQKGVLNKGKLNRPSDDIEQELDRENITPLNIGELEQLYDQIHTNQNLNPCTELNPYSILPQITQNSIFLN